MKLRLVVHAETLRHSDAPEEAVYASPHLCRRNECHMCLVALCGDFPAAEGSTGVNIRVLACPGLKVQEFRVQVSGLRLRL